MANFGGDGGFSSAGITNDEDKIARFDVVHILIYKESGEVFQDLLILVTMNRVMRISMKKLEQNNRYRIMKT